MYPVRFGTSGLPADESPRDRRILVLIIAAATLLRLTLFLAVVGHPDRFFTVDAHGYVALGSDLFRNYSVQEGRLFELGLLRTPGYPSFIALLYAVSGQSPAAVIVAQTVLGVATVWLTYRLTLALLGPTPALWSAGALAVDPITIVLTNELQPEAVYTFLLVGGALLWRRAVDEASSLSSGGAGMIFGVAALFRHIGLYLPVVLIPIGWFLATGRWTRRLAVSLALLIAFGVPVAAWIARNASVTGVAIFSSGEGYNFLYLRAAGALAEEEGLTLLEAEQRLRVEVAERIRPRMNPAEVSVVERSFGMEVLFDHPRGALISAAKGILLMMSGPGRAELLQQLGDDDATQVDGVVETTLVVVQILVYGLILLGAVVGVVVLLRRRMSRELIFLGGFILYFVLISAGPEAYSRFRVPIMTFIAVLSGCGWSMVASRRVERRRRAMVDR
jgi:4-amino-4-deoxy-L-arabinose transferase-like glycosyltransferase